MSSITAYIVPDLSPVDQQAINVHTAANYGGKFYFNRTAQIVVRLFIEIISKAVFFVLWQFSYSYTLKCPDTNTFC